MLLLFKMKHNYILWSVYILLYRGYYLGFAITIFVSLEYINTLGREAFLR